MLILALSLSISFLLANDESEVTDAVKMHWKYSNNKEWGNYAKSMHSKGTLNGDSNGSFWYMQESTASAVRQGLSPNDKQNFTPKYIEVEIGFPNRPEALIMQYAEDRNEPTETVYAYVPATVVTLVIAKHGGMVEGELPAGIPCLRAQ